MAAWSAATALKFQERTAATAASIRTTFTSPFGSNPIACLSMGIGMMGGKQNVELVEGCGFGQIVHEIGHSSACTTSDRADRDSHVRVQFATSFADMAASLGRIWPKTRTSGLMIIDSIMHLRSYAFLATTSRRLSRRRRFRPGRRSDSAIISARRRGVINSIYK